MALNLRWRPQAREDLLVIYEFIGLDNPPPRPNQTFLKAALRKGE
jgi:plasmid stabilization system protein ParE